MPGAAPGYVLITFWLEPIVSRRKTHATNWNNLKCSTYPCTDKHFTCDVLGQVIEKCLVMFCLTSVFLMLWKYVCSDWDFKVLIFIITANLQLKCYWKYIQLRHMYYYIGCKVHRKCILFIEIVSLGTSLIVKI